ncbi:hypothetical protein [Geodermatophilus maliterrae]|uniref:Uncharacterized protein n=1 Tax=Geodermatophilus maliterrae TaxID=3162531 RepID=A0ABV3XJS7_9ACTN
MTLQVCRAVPHDVPAAADVLADAVTDHPWTRWTIDADGHRERLAALHRLFLSAVAVPFGRVDVGRAGERLSSVAVWVPGGALPDDAWARWARWPPGSRGTGRRPRTGPRRRWPSAASTSRT